VKSSAIDSNLPDLDNAVAVVASLRVPQWDAPEDDGGILAGPKVSLLKKYFPCFYLFLSNPSICLYWTSP
jgi:hypothetical protein